GPSGLTTATGAGAVGAAGLAGANAAPPAPKSAVTNAGAPPTPAAPGGAAAQQAAAKGDAPRWAVHVASYRAPADAAKDIAQLQKDGFQANAIETDLGSTGVKKGIWYRVYVGSFATVAEAEATRDSILHIPGYNYAQVHRLPR